MEWANVIKVQLYLAKGAHEVWVVNENGDTNYYAHEGQIPHSRAVRE